MKKYIRNDGRLWTFKELDMLQELAAERALAEKHALIEQPLRVATAEMFHEENYARTEQIFS